MIQNTFLEIFKIWTLRGKSEQQLFFIIEIEKHRVISTIRKIIVFNTMKKGVFKKIH